MSIFRSSYGVVVGTNYLVVFVLLVIIYYKILKRIKRIRVLHGEKMSMAVTNLMIAIASLAPLFFDSLYLHTPTVASKKNDVITLSFIHPPTSHVYLSFLYVTSLFPSSILPWSSGPACCALPQRTIMTCTTMELPRH